MRRGELPGEWGCCPAGKQRNVLVWCRWSTGPLFTGPALRLRARERRISGRAAVVVRRQAGRCCETWHRLGDGRDGPWIGVRVGGIWRWA